MHTVNIHEAKTQLSRLVDQAARGEPFVIAKAGKPLVKVMPLDTPTAGQGATARLSGGLCRSTRRFRRDGTYRDRAAVFRLRRPFPFCRKFLPPDAPETRAKRAGAFSTFYKMDSFVERHTERTAKH
jgi:prevent-host-death family protein